MTTDRWETPIEGLVRELARDTTKWTPGVSRAGARPGPRLANGTGPRRAIAELTQPNPWPRRGTTDTTSPSYAAALVELEERFEAALRALECRYQPIVTVRTRTTVGFELQLTCSDPELATEPRLWEAAERLGRVGRLGRRIRHCAAAELGRAPLRPGQRVFLRIHPDELDSPELTSRFMPLGRVANRVALVIGQLQAVLVAYGLAAAGTLLIALVLRGLGVPFRVPAQAENLGVDVQEHGEEAYAERVGSPQLY